MFSSVSSCGNSYEHIYHGPDSENDAKLAFLRESKKMQNKGTVTIEKIEAGRWQEAGHKVVCTYSPEGYAQQKREDKAKLKHIREEMQLLYPDDEIWKLTEEEHAEQMEALEYRMEYGRKQNPRKKKKKPTARNFEAYTGLEPLSFEEDTIPTPSQGCAVKESLKKRIFTDCNPGSPPTRHYWYGSHGRRWSGRGKKSPYKNWKSKRKTQYSVK